MASVSCWSKEEEKKHLQGFPTAILFKSGKPSLYPRQCVQDDSSGQVKHLEILSAHRDHPFLVRAHEDLASSVNILNLANNFEAEKKYKKNQSSIVHSPPRRSGIKKEAVKRKGKEENLFFNRTFCSTGADIFQVATDALP